MVVKSLAYARRVWHYPLVMIVAAGIAAAGCTSGARPHAGAHASAHARAKVELTLVMRGDSASHAKARTLTCEPAGGNQPAAAAVCSALLKVKQKNPFAPIAAGKNCPMLLRSNRKILVTGTWFGVKVHRLVVDGGCDMRLFDSLTHP